MADPLAERFEQALADRYLLERELGQGGMATVYLAHDVRHERKVALKVLRPELAAIIGAERFLAEIRVTAGLQHPHILPLFDSGQVAGQLFYVMPYVAGESLRARLERERQLPVADALRIAREVASALDYAHRHGVIHRDIKPENILLQDGTALVADFGIALAISNSGGARLTQTGLSLGTPGYMSPEQAAGERTLDGRTDVYALGAVCYEMLTGQPPFSAPTTQALIAKLMTEEPLAPSTLRKSVLPHLDAAILSALEKLPADRPPTPAAFAEAITDATARVSGRARGGRGRGWRASLTAGLALGAFAGVLAGALGAWRLLDRTPRAGEERRAQLTFTGQATSPAISPDGEFVAYVNTACTHAQVDGCRSTLFVQEVGSTQAVPVLSGALLLGAPRWSHDGAIIVVAGMLDSARTGLFAVPRLGGTPRPLGASAEFDTHPSGDTIVVIRQRGDSASVAQIVSLADGTVVDSLHFPFGGVHSVSWAPDGRRLAFTAGAFQLRIVGRDGRETATQFLASRAPVRWTVAGDALLTFRIGAGREDELVRIAVDGEGRMRGAPQVVMSRVPTLFEGRFDVARRTGRLVLATGTATSDVWSLELAGGSARARQLTRGTTWYGTPALSPDGGTAYYLRGDALGDNVYEFHLADGTEEPLTADRQGGIDAVRLSADGHRLAYGHGGPRGLRLELLELPSRRASGRDLPGGGFASWPVGERGILNYSFPDSSMSVFDSLQAPPRPIPMPDSLGVVTAAPAPDGRHAAFLAWSRGGMVLGVASLAAPEVRTLHRLERAPAQGLTWDNDGGIYLGRWLPADATPSIWRTTEAGGELLRVASLPVPCAPVTILVAARGRAAVCQVYDNRSDIWTIEGIGGSRRTDAR